VVDKRFENAPDKVVWKYVVPLSARPETIQVPTGARLLHVEYMDVNNRGFYLWYEVNLKYRDQTIDHVFQTWGTGDATIPRAAKHVHSGISWREDHRGRRTLPEYVWHLYEYPTGAKVVDV
jgi:hypothetical protein